MHDLRREDLSQAALEQGDHRGTGRAAGALVVSKQGSTVGQTGYFA